MYFSAKIDEQKCTGCRLCLATCPDPNVIGFLKERKKALVNPKRCKGCGLCVTICKPEAISVQATN